MCTRNKQAWLNKGKQELDSEVHIVTIEVNSHVHISLCP